MVNKYVMTEEQALYAIDNKEFGEDIVSSSKNVIVVMTQDWCPQWVAMKRWIYELNTEEDVSIFEIEYNKTDYFYKFMNFKERILHNDQVPYLRFYKNGLFFKDTNYIGKDTVKKIIEANGN